MKMKRFLFCVNWLVVNTINVTVEITNIKNPLNICLNLRTVFFICSMVFLVSEVVCTSENKFLVIRIIRERASVLF